jgi:UDP-N-acetylglucosamine 4,6-dehydratase
MLEGKTVLVTGGTGSFGKAFTRIALDMGVKQIRVLSRDELKQHEMAQEFSDPRVEFLLGDVRDLERLKLATSGCDIVVHAAALKRIEKCERDPGEAVNTNVTGSVNVAKACLANNVAHAVLISTDKACEPINLYGATKMVAEKYWIQANQYRGTNFKTAFSVVRYGTVIGSRGSVIPIFKKQAKNGVIKVTDPEMTRFLISLEQAVDLVLIAITNAQGGEIYIPELKAARIVDIAQAVDSKARVEYIGMGHYEKLHEQLYNQSEANHIVAEEGYFVIEPEKPNWPFKHAPAVMHEPPKTSEDVEFFSKENLRRIVEGK